MFAVWLEDHTDSIVDAYVAWRRNLGDDRPEDIIRNITPAVRRLARALCGETDYAKETAATARRVLESGTPISVLSDVTRGLYAAILAVLNRDMPEDGAAWISDLGSLLLLASQSVTATLEASLEEQVERRTQEMSLFRALVDGAADAVFVGTQAGTISYANRASYALFGYDLDQQEMIGLHAEALSPADVVQRLMNEAFPQAMEKGLWQGELRQMRKDGTLFDAHLTTFPVAGGSPEAGVWAAVVRDISARKQAEAERLRLQQEVIDAQRAAILELSTPIIPIMDQIIVLPLVGSIDTGRAREVTRTLLRGISQYRAKVVIIDVTGVPVVDTGVAGHLDKTIQAARLKGARTIVTGISDAVAETIVDLGVDWSDIETLRDMQSGLVLALHSLGAKLITSAS